MLEKPRFSAFFPHPLLRDQHAMTVAGAMLPRPSGPFNDLAEKRWLKVDDETSVLLELNIQQQSTRPMLVMVHGLSGSSQSPYMLGIAQKAFLQGWSVIRVNIRNCGGSEKRTPTLYHAALTDDVEAVFEMIAKEFPLAPIALTGYSLGGSIITHTVANWGSSPPEQLKAMVCVSTPFNLVSTSRTMHKGFMNRMYMKKFLIGFMKSMKNKAAQFPELYPQDASYGYEDFYSFDQQWTAPAFGFDGSSDYYNRASALHVIKDVKVPTLIIHSEDDPLVPYCEPTRDAVEANPNMRLLLAKRGGHCGFFGAKAANSLVWSDIDRWWAENRVIEYCAYRFEKAQKTQ
ncbi:MAG: alpha/beta fold hydrolase [Planctomycetes bacterium]|nr:alpha/beta fold hydrolase [Planctomycetota bacterium]